MICLSLFVLHWRTSLLYTSFTPSYGIYVFSLFHEFSFASHYSLSVSLVCFSSPLSSWVFFCLLVDSIFRLTVATRKWTNLKFDLTCCSFYYCWQWCLRYLKTYSPKLNGPLVFRGWWLSNKCIQIDYNRWGRIVDPQMGVVTVENYIS